jgi:predicted GIY-YIG superfamily endonuclease
MSAFAPTFEIEPFPVELERARAGVTRAPRGGGSKPVPRPPYGPHWPHWPAWRRRRDVGLRDSLVGPSYAPEPDGTERPPAGESLPSPPSEYVRWVQDTLNRVLGGSFAVDGVMTGAVRRWIRVFQRKNRLPVSGYIGPDTEAALRRAAREGEQGELEFEWELSGDALTAENALSAAKAVPVAAALKSLGKEKVPGLYRFHASNGRFYTGMAIDLRRRIVQHLWCLSHFGKSARGFRLALHRLPNLTEKQIRALESAINEHHRNNSNRLNKVTELEVLELSEI